MSAKVVIRATRLGFASILQEATSVDARQAMMVMATLVVFW